MIRSFRHKGLAELYRTGKAAKVAAELQARILRRLDALNTAGDLADLNLPGFDFHPLRGFKPTRYSLHVNGPWCITFEFLRVHSPPLAAIKAFVERSLLRCFSSKRSRASSALRMQIPRGLPRVCLLGRRRCSPRGSGAVSLSEALILLVIPAKAGTALPTAQLVIHGR